MSLEVFVQGRRQAWQRLDQTLQAMQRRGPRGVAGAELGEMIHLYRDASSDLARLRSAGADPALVAHVNRLVTRAHGQIYRGERRRGVEFTRFFIEQYPRLFRETWRFTLASFLCVLSFALMSYATVRERPDVVADILGGADTELYGARTAADIRDRFRAVASPVLSSTVTSNNIMVALNAFALGITFGVGTVVLLIINGVMLGGFAGAYAQSGVGAEFWITILPHGALELSAIIIAGGAGLMMGYALWCPGPRTRLRALREEAGKAARLAVGLIPAFMVAGFFEGFITPNDTLPDAVKVTLGVLVAVVFWAYLIVGGRRIRSG